MNRSRYRLLFHSSTAFTTVSVLYCSSECSSDYSTDCVSDNSLECSSDYLSDYVSEWTHYFNGAGDKAAKWPLCQHRNNSGKQRVVHTLVIQNVPAKSWVTAYFADFRPDYTTDYTTDCTHFLRSSSAFPMDSLRDDSSDCSHFLLSRRLSLRLAHGMPCRIARQIALISYFHCWLSLRLARGMPHQIARWIA